MIFNSKQTWLLKGSRLFRPARHTTISMNDRQVSKSTLLFSDVWLSPEQSRTFWDSELNWEWLQINYRIVELKQIYNKYDSVSVHSYIRRMEKLHRIKQSKDQIKCSKQTRCEQNNKFMKKKEKHSRKRKVCCIFKQVFDIPKILVFSLLWQSGLINLLSTVSYIHLHTYIHAYKFKFKIALLAWL